MARSSSVISVSIIGDAKKLIGATKQADAATGGLLKSAAKIAIGLKVVDTGFDFLKGATEEGDRLGDAMARLEHQLGPQMQKNLADTAGNFAKIGASKQDILELEANFAAAATALQIGNPAIQNTAEHAAAIATAFALVKEQNPADIMKLITNAAGGSAKAAKELGVSLIDTKDSGAQLNNILGQLNGYLTDVTTKTPDLEQQQAALQARIETLQGEIGDRLNPVLADMLQFILDEIDAIPSAIAGWDMLGREIHHFVDFVLGPLGNVRDMLQSIINLFERADHLQTDAFGSGSLHSRQPGATDQSIAAAIARQRERNGLGQ